MVAIESTSSTSLQNGKFPPRRSEVSPAFSAVCAREERVCCRKTGFRMEKTRVLIRLRDSERDRPPNGGDIDAGSPRSRSGTDVAVSRASATSVRLEDSAMPSRSSTLSFDRVFDEQDSSADLFEQSLAPAVDKMVADGTAMTVVATGASRAGKSHCIHGNCHSGGKDKGLLEVAIERVFATLAGYDEWQVSVAAAFTVTEKPSELGSLVDPFAGESIQSDPTDFNVQHDTFRSRAVRVDSATEAALAYRYALEQSQKDATLKGNGSDFVCVLYAESRSKLGEIRIGRLVCIDIHGANIMEPLSFNNQTEFSSLFAESRLPVNRTLTHWCGAFLGNESLTFLIVVIQKSAQKHQQAVLSLFYACKAREITSVLTPQITCSFLSLPTFGKLQLSIDEPIGEGIQLALSGLSMPSPIESIRRQRYTSDLLSEKLRQAYKSVKSGSNPRGSSRSTSLVTNEESISTPPSMKTLHARVDSILEAMEPEKTEFERLSLLGKLDKIADHYREMDQAVHNDASIKKKCAERIAKLSQTMSFKIDEHEKIVRLRDEENVALKNRLEEMQSKYDEAEKTLEKLQQQVEAMKVTTRERLGARSPGKTSNERALLQQFSLRLEKAMSEAKAVVELKDTAIRELEARSAQVEATNTHLKKSLAEVNERLIEEQSLRRTKESMWEQEKAEFKDERMLWDSQTAELLESKAQLEDEKMQLASTAAQEKASWEAEKALLERDLARLSSHAQSREKEEAVLQSTRAELDEVKTRWIEATLKWEEEKSRWKAERDKLVGEESGRKEHIKLLEAKLAEQAADDIHWGKTVVDLEFDLSECRREVELLTAREQEALARLSEGERQCSARIQEMQSQFGLTREAILMEHSAQLSVLQTTISTCESTLLDREHLIEKLSQKLSAAEDAAESARKRAKVLESELHGLHDQLSNEKMQMENKLRLLVSESNVQQNEADRLGNEMAQNVKRLEYELETLRAEKDVLIAEREDLSRRLDDEIAKADSEMAQNVKRLEYELETLRGEREYLVFQQEKYVNAINKLKFERAQDVEHLGRELEFARADRDCQVTDKRQLMGRLADEELQRNELKQQLAVSFDQIAVLQKCNQQLEADKDLLREELGRRTQDLKQCLSEQEAELVAACERKVQDLMERHASELLQRDLELRRLRKRRQAPPLPVVTTAQTSSLSSSSSSSASSSDLWQLQQHNLDQLEGIDGTESKHKLKTKRLHAKLVRQKQKVVDLRQQVDSLTHALAIANEQESLANEAMEKQHALYERLMYAQEELQTQLNVHKAENWLLLLALEVTEKRGAQRGPEMKPSPGIFEY